DRQRAPIGRLVADDHAEERGLAGAVRPDHPDDSTRRQEEREPVDEEAVTVSLHQALGVYHPVTEARTGRDGDVQRVGVAVCGTGLGLGYQGVVGADAGLPLALTGPGGHTDPLELAFEGL